MKKTILYKVIPVLVVFLCLAIADVIHLHDIYPNMSLGETAGVVLSLNSIPPPVQQSHVISGLGVHDGTPVDPSHRKQFVVFAFDGSRSLPMWQETRAFAQEMASSGTPVHFTYFINGVYLLQPKDWSVYQAPHEPRGVSNIGFGDSQADVLSRIDQINGALAEGHEIGSHNMGHFNGVAWSYDEWKGQLDLFSQTVLHADLLNPVYKLNLKQSDIVGFRAPELGVNQSMFQALKDDGYGYDCSLVSLGNIWPKRLSTGLWEFPLTTLTMLPKHNPVVGMDYSIYMNQTKAKDVFKKGTPEWQTAYQYVYDSYMNYFNKSYTGNHAPIYMANHFSLWNDGLYWEVMKNFARNVCSKPDVQCGSYKDLMVYMNEIDK